MFGGLFLLVFRVALMDGWTTVGINPAVFDLNRSICPLLF